MRRKLLGDTNGSREVDEAVIFLRGNSDDFP
jgi:hypothetical protein